MIEIPEVPPGQPQQEWSAERGTQTLQMLNSTLGNIRMYSSEIEEEITAPKVTILPTNRVWLHNAETDMVAYMSDPNADARLILDDYFPEDESDPDAQAGSS